MWTQGDSMPTFFLSAAAGDDDHYVNQFFQDLRRQVTALAGRSEGNAAFLGVAPNTLRVWPHDMVTALARCEVFVAVCSPRYFLNKVCAKQWWIFEDRLRRYEQRAGVRVPALIALPWTNVDAVARAAAARVGMPKADVPQRSLRQYVRLRSLRDQYHAVVAGLARRIVETATAHLIPHSGSAPDLVSTPDHGTPRVHFVLSAGSRDEMAKVRDDLTFYGPDRQDWAPYLPMLRETLAERARSVAADQLMTCDVGDIDDAVGRVEQAHENNEMVVVLLDSWTTRFDSYRRVLAEIDGRGLNRTAVLVPANRIDAETARHHDQLRYGLRRAFRNATAAPDPMFRTEIATAHHFDVDLARVMEEAQNRMFREPTRHRLPPDDAPGDRPILAGP